MQGQRIRYMNYTIKERQGQEIISSMIWNPHISDVTGVTGVTWLGLATKFEHKTEVLGGLWK